MIYFDNAATTSLHSSVLQAMMPYLTHDYGNPNSVHAAGNDAAWAVDEARERIAGALDCQPREVEFTSGGTEADNQALLTAALWGAQAGKRHIVTSTIEHPAVLRMAERLERHDFTVTYVNPDKNGVVTADAVEAALRPDTCLVSLMWVNNEVGSMQPVRQVAALCHERGILFHTDAVQAAGLLPVNCADAGIDLLSLSAHKFHGPKGVGALVACGIEPASLLVGGAQERGHRAGTLNVPGIVGMAEALDQAQRSCVQNAAHVAGLRSRLVRGLRDIPGVSILGPLGSADDVDGDKCSVLPVDEAVADRIVAVTDSAEFSAELSSREAAAPGIVCAAFEGLERETLLVLLDQAGICVSAGSACSAGAVETSHVLRAIEVPERLARGAIRFSLGVDNTADEVDEVLRQVRRIVERLQQRRSADDGIHATSASIDGPGAFGYDGAMSEGGRA